MRNHFKGWATYETWCLAYRMNDPENLRYWRALAESYKKEESAALAGDDPCPGARHPASASLARDIRRQLDDDVPLTANDLYRELLYSAIDAIDFEAIAERLLRGHFGEDGDPRPGSLDDDSRGYLSYETYIALLWATADGHAVAHWFETARSCLEESRRASATNRGTSNATSLFAEALRDQLPGIVQDGASPVQGGLIDCALSRIDWPELAHRLLREYGLTTPGGPESISTERPADPVSHRAARDVADSEGPSKSVANGPERNATRVK